MKLSIKIYPFLLNAVGTVFINTVEIFAGENDLPISMQNLSMQEMQERNLAAEALMELRENDDSSSSSARDSTRGRIESENNSSRKYTQEQYLKIEKIRRYLDGYDKNKKSIALLNDLIIKTLNADSDIFDIEDLYRIFLFSVEMVCLSTTPSFTQMCFIAMSQLTHLSTKIDNFSQLSPRSLVGIHTVYFGEMGKDNGNKLLEALSASKILEAKKNFMRRNPNASEDDHGKFFQGYIDKNINPELFSKASKNPRYNELITYLVRIIEANPEKLLMSDYKELGRSCFPYLEKISEAIDKILQCQGEEERVKSTGQLARPGNPSFLEKIFANSSLIIGSMPIQKFAEEVLESEMPKEGYEKLQKDGVLLDYITAKNRFFQDNPEVEREWKGKLWSILENPEKATKFSAWFKDNKENRNKSLPTKLIRDLA